MGIRGSLRLPAFGVAFLAALGLFLLFGGESLADPDEIDNFSACPASGACGSLCFFADCVHCSECFGSDFCNPCIPVWIPPEQTCDSSDPPVCSTTPGYWTVCPSPSSLYVDWHSFYSGGAVPTWDTPQHPPDNPCAAVGNPYHTLLSYSYDCPSCEVWDWKMVGGGTGLETRDQELYPLVRLQLPTNLESALAFGGNNLRHYRCRDMQTGATSVPPRVTPDRVMGLEENFGVTEGGALCSGGSGPCSGDVLLDGGIGSSDPPALPSNLVPISGTPGGSLALLSVTLSEDGMGHPMASLQVAGIGGRPLFYRFWVYTGQEAPLDLAEFHPLSGDFSLVRPGEDPATVLGVYSFQVAVENGDGTLERSAVRHIYVGFEQALRQGPPGSVTFSPSVSWPGAGGPDDAPLVGVPAATPLPMLTPVAGGPVLPRPVSPVILQVTPGMATPVSGPGDENYVDLTLSPYSGVLEYRAWTYTGNRPHVNYSPWHRVTVGGSPPVFRVSGLSVPQYYVFEVRAVGIVGGAEAVGDASPSETRFVAGIPIPEIPPELHPLP